MDNRAIIHIYTNAGKILRLPVYFHLYTDLVKFTPSIVDFGVIPFNFDILRVKVEVHVRPGSNIKTLALNDV